MCGFWDGTSRCWPASGIVGLSSPPRVPARLIGYKHNVTAQQVEVGYIGSNTTEQHLQALKCTAAVVAAYLSAGASALKQQASSSEYSSCKLEWTPDKGAEYPLGHSFGIAQWILSTFVHCEGYAAHQWHGVSFTWHSATQQWQVPGS